MTIIRYFINDVELTEKEYAQHLRNKYVKEVPVGYTSKEISSMSDSDILDMNYFLNELNDIHI